MAERPYAELPISAREALERARTVLLVDWHEDVPRSLIAAGYEVLSTHEGWFRHEVLEAPPAEADVQVMPPRAPHHLGYLVSRPMAAAPERADMVCSYRPPAEQLAIVRDLVIPLGAKWFWVERGDETFTHPDPVIPAASDEARAACAAAAVAVIEDVSVPVALASLHRGQS